MELDDILEAARECGFRDVDVITQLTRPAALLSPNEEDSSSASHSRLGGRPHLPPGVAWPRRDGRPVALIAQIDLASQPPSLARQGFPEDGMLLFFYDADQGAWGFDPKHAGSFAVIYVDSAGSTAAAAAAERRDWPTDRPEEACYPPVGLTAEETLLLPPWDSPLLNDFDLDEEQSNAYQELLDRINGDEWASRCLLGGYPDQIQNDMTLECTLVAAGLYCGDGKVFKDPRLPSFRQQAHDWRLLLQVPSLKSAEMMWGDMGCLYYWIREDDLRARRFDRAWMILQCS